MTDRHRFDIGDVERLLDDFILEHRLEVGSRLPGSQELAAQFACGEGLLAKAMHAAEAKGRVSRGEGIWTVASPEVLHDHSFSFTKSAHGRGLTTEVIEAAVRLPISNEEDPFYLFENSVHEVLGFPRHLPFIVIQRLRLLDGHPGAFQRAYLNPARFPGDFLDRHNFKAESLIEIYAACGYALLSRDTVLAARFANVYEINTLRKYSPSLETRAVLDAEQRLYAEAQNEESPFVLELLKASYLENWRYEIKNRPASVLS